MGACGWRLNYRSSTGRSALQKEKLLAIEPGQRTWPQKLRLLHLVSLQLCASPDIRRQIESDQATVEDAPPSPERDLCVALAADLAGPGSPYRPRSCSIWQEKDPDAKTDPPQLTGRLQNASLTHLGAIEVIRLDEKMKPKEIAFVGLQEIRALLLASPALFRPGKVIYEDGHAEMVWVPLLYGFSWTTPHEYDRDGTMTRFVAQLPKDDGPQRCIGIGHQDLIVVGEEKEKRTFLGLGSVTEISTALDLREPDFEEKCQLRGLDPAEVRKSAK